MGSGNTTPWSRRALLGATGIAATAAYLGSEPAQAAPKKQAGEAWPIASYRTAGQGHVPRDRDLVSTAGYHRPGDGGGATYRRIAQAPAEPRRWHLRTADGSWFEIADDVVSVKALGAAGDYDEATGQGADDTEAFEQATQLDRQIYVPGTALTYRVTRAIMITRDGSVWFGDGYRSKITLFSVEDGVGQLIGIRGVPPATADGAPRHAVRGVRISGLHLDTRNTRNNNGLGGSFLADVSIDNLYFSRIGRKAVTFQYHCTNVHVRDITIYDAAREPNSTQGAISVEGQTEGVDLVYAGGVPHTADLGGTDVSNISFTNVSVAKTGYNYIVVSNAHRVTFENIDLGDTERAGSFVSFIRQTWDCQVRTIRGGDTARRILFFDGQVHDCTVEDFQFGATTGATADGRAIQCTGPGNSFRRGTFGHRNSTAVEAIWVDDRDVRLSEITVRECTAQMVLNGTPAAENLSLTRSTFTSATARALRTKGPRSLVHGNRFHTPGPSPVLFEGPGNQFADNYLEGTGTRIQVTPPASAVVTGNVFDEGARLDVQGGTANPTLCRANLNVADRG